MEREIPSSFESIPSPTIHSSFRKKHEYGSRIRVSFPNSLAIVLIELYQEKTKNKEHVCCYYPSCSEYARLAYLLYGFIPASILTYERLKNCSDPMSDWPKENKP